MTNKDNARLFAEYLCEQGPHWECTYRWFDEGRVTEDRWEEIAMKEMHGVLASEVFIGLLPGRLGTHTEFGLALANPQRRIILAAQDAKPFHNDADYWPSIFYMAPGVRHWVSIPEERNWIACAAYAVDSLIARGQLLAGFIR